MRRPSRARDVAPAVLAVLAVAVVSALAAAPTVPPAASWQCERPGTGAADRARSGTSGVVSGGVVGGVIGAEQDICPPDGPDGDALAVDGRTFTRGGEPFFWLGDTAWSLFVNLTRAETEEYLDTRAEQGFTVVQAVAVFPQAGGPGPNQYGDSPYGTGLDDLTVTAGAGDAGEEQYDYWDHVDFVVEQAAARGLVLAMLPVWADTQVGELLTDANAGAYGEFLGKRYGDAANVTWVLGGDAPADGAEAIWHALADGIRTGGGAQLMTYHPRGDQSSVTWFEGDERIGFHMLQGGHCLRHDTRAELVERTYAAALPFVDGEPIYEDHPYCWRPEDGFSTAQDVRRDAYGSVLGGAAGHTYGHHAVWQFLAEGRSAELGARGSWTEALRSPGAEQMQNLRALVGSRPRVEPAAVVADPGSGAGRIQSAVAADGSTLMAYTAAGREVAVDLGVLAGTSAQPWWFDPRTGDATRLDPVTGGGRATFTPPATEGDEADWVLVVDDAGAGLGPPGADRFDTPAPTGEPDPDLTGASGQDLDDPGTGPGPTVPERDDSDRDESEPEAPDSDAEPKEAPASGADPVWERLARCESSGDWGIDTGNGYYGGLQFSEATWKDYGGTEFAPHAHLATREEQIIVAARVRDDRGGYGSWPACANRLDLPRWSW